MFEWEQLDTVGVKGKSEPLQVWRPLAPRARFGSDVTRTHTTPLVGRELEKPLLIGTFERAASQQSCQLVTVVGEPGVGKSRLCTELFEHIEQRPGLVRWRQGRCLPYGDGISFWALGEIVKAECGILETDTADEAAAKLARAVASDDPDRAWLLARLAPLVGAGGAEAAGNHTQAAALYADAARRWQQFGNLPERAHALLRQGRSLHALDNPEAEQPLRLARDLFAQRGYEPALNETEALLQQAEAPAPS